MLPQDLPNRLDRAPDPHRDHMLGTPDAPITLVEYGSYDCPHCRAANEVLAAVRDRMGDRLVYVFRHRPITGSDLARRAAELAECAPDADSFWEAHVTLMSRSHQLGEADLRAVETNLGLDAADHLAMEDLGERARLRVRADEASARESGVMFTPTFFINGRRYDGPWDETSVSDAMLGRLGHRVRSAALGFASWGPSAGVLLLLATLLALILSNSGLGPGFAALWQAELGINLGGAALSLSLLHWVNDGLLTLFFLVVGLEIKRELTTGHLTSRRSAALPIAAALGGMVVPALIFLAVIPAGPLARGWGIPMATDTAFAVALIVMLGRRVPVELRIFLTAAAIVDDIGGIAVVALFYSDALHLWPLVGAGALTLALAGLARGGVYRVAPYALLGGLLWLCLHESGLHATLAGVILALAIPTRPPANFPALTAQADAIIAAEAARGQGVLRHGPSLPALHALDAIHDRMESPADRVLRHMAARSSYLILPLFALANAGVALSAADWAGHERLMLAIVLALSLGKPLGILAASALAVRLKIAEKPAAYSWMQLAGAAALAGIGFTMSLFISGQAYPASGDFIAAKLAIFLASLLSALIGTAILWRAWRPEAEAAEEARAPLRDGCAAEPAQ